MQFQNFQINFHPARPLYFFKINITIVISSQYHKTKRQAISSDDFDRGRPTLLASPVVTRDSDHRIVKSTHPAGNELSAHMSAITLRLIPALPSPPRPAYGLSSLPTNPAPRNLTISSPQLWSEFLPSAVSQADVGRGGGQPGHAPKGSKKQVF